MCMYERGTLSSLSLLNIRSRFIENGSSFLDNGCNKKELEDGKTVLATILCNLTANPSL